MHQPANATGRLLTIRKPQDLQLLLDRRIRFSRVRLADDLFPPSKRNQLERELAGHYFSCGCAEAIIGMLATVTIALVASHPYFIAGRINLAGFWLVILAAGATGLILGKALGLAWARLRLRKQIGELRKRWRTDDDDGLLPFSRADLLASVTTEWQ